MRDLAQAGTIRSAAFAAAVTTVACFPRLLLWTKRSYPLWYLGAVLFLGAIVLWAFVFAWHERYSGRPPFVFKIGLIPFVSATLAGVLGAVTLHQFLDPTFRQLTPAEFPTDLKQWLAMTLFALTLNQLLLVFAPVDWLLRLFRSRPVAVGLSVLFGVFVVVIKTEQMRVACPFPLLAALIAARVASSSLAICFYLRGGVLLVWWMEVLIEARYLFDLKAVVAEG